MQQVLSKNADIGFCGPEQVMYIYNQHRDDYPILLGQLTATDGSFLVGRKSIKNFKWQNLKGKSIIGGRPGGMPEMSLEYALKQNGLNPKQDVKMITNVDFTATAGAFKSGNANYVALFEPTASMLEKDKSGYIVSSIGKTVGKLPYTCYFATKSYIKQNPKVLQKFMNAIYKGQVWVKNHSDLEIAKCIKPFFPGADQDILASVMKNYKNIGAFAKDPIIQEENLDKLMNIIQSYDKELLPQKPEYVKIVNNEFSENAVEDLK